MALFYSIYLVCSAEFFFITRQVGLNTVVDEIRNRVAIQTRLFILCRPGETGECLTPKHLPLEVNDGRG